MSEAVYTALFPFCGLGAGALGFQGARARLFNRDARIVSLGGIDLDADACKDFETLTGTPALCADVSTMTAAELRAFASDAQGFSLSGDGSVWARERALSAAVH